MTEYRVGRKLGRTIYRDEKLIGMMDTVEDATYIVDLLNADEKSNSPDEKYCALCGALLPTKPNEQ